MTLDPKQRERYSRMLALRDFNDDDMESIMASTVSVVGAGGLGCPALRLLSAIGFGRIRIIDRDIVELSNIQRQTLYNTEDIGRPKAEVAAENLEGMNPEVYFEPMCTSVEEGTAKNLLRGSDIVVDGLDSFKARRHLNRATLELGIPYIFAGAVEYYANLTTFVPGRTGCLQCVIGDATDSPENSCASIGVDPMVLSVAASIEVREAVLLALGRPPKLMNRLMTIDISALEFDFFDVGRSDNCQVCSNLSLSATEVESDILSVNPMCIGNFSVAPSKITPLDLDLIASRLEKKYEVKRRKRSLTITVDSEKRVTLMRGGSAVVRGVSSSDEAKALYLQLLNN